MTRTPYVTEQNGHFSVRRSVYSDPEVTQLELRSIFRKRWLFLGHESEIPDAGDYVLRRLGIDPVIVTRDEQGEVRVLGNSSHFRCPYHGWTYANDGRLIGVTHMPEVYGRDFDKSRFPLYAPSQVQSVFGLIFACWDQDAPSLEEELADGLWYLESIFGKWRNGVEVLGTPMRTLTRANWKPESENIGGDGYHTPSTHQSAFVLRMFAGPDDWVRMGPVTSERYIGRVVDCGNGHTFRVHHLPVTPEEPAFFGYPRAMWPEMAQRLDAGQVDVQNRLSILHGTIFPNLTVMENFKTSTERQGSACRYIRLTQEYPVAPDRNEMLWWGFVPKDAPPEWRTESQHANVRTVGPAGLFQIDDTENYVGMSDSHAGDVLPEREIVLEGGMRNELAQDVSWRGKVYAADKSEQTMRAFWRRWDEVVADADVDEPALAETAR
jgi:phenylpropionate dioxygenase-like ring-hydroxylating dioxygenase large terminal subunit